MLISCDRRMQAVLFLKPTQPVFHSMIQLRLSAQTHTRTHTHKLGKRHAQRSGCTHPCAHDWTACTATHKGAHKHDTNTLSTDSSCLRARHRRASNWLSSLSSNLLVCMCVCVWVREIEKESQKKWEAVSQQLYPKYFFPKCSGRIWSFFCDEINTFPGREELLAIQSYVKEKNIKKKNTWRSWHVIGQSIGHLAMFLSIIVNTEWRLNFTCQT